MNIAFHIIQRLSRETALFVAQYNHKKDGLRTKAVKALLSVD